MDSFQEWCEQHGGSYETAGMDKFCTMDGLEVGLMPDGTGGEIVVVQDPDNRQGTDYRAPRSEVEFGDDEIRGEFIGNMRDKTNIELP